MKRWKIRRGHCDDCGRDGYIIWDHESRLYGCRPTHAEAVEFATQKARGWFKFILESA